MLIVAKQLQRLCLLLNSTNPSEDNSHEAVVPEVFSNFLSHVYFLHLFISRKERWSFKDNALFRSIHGRASLAMEGKSVVPML